MPRYQEDTDMSELEREFELEMEQDDASGETSYESGDDDTRGGAAEMSFEIGDEEFESDSDEREFEGDPSGFADRFFELSQREFESDGERDEALQGIVREMEADYFLGKLIRGGSSLLRKVKKMSKGGAFAMLKSAAKQLAGPLSGNLGALASAALSAYPGGALIAPTLMKTLGFNKELDDPGAQQEAWNNFVSFSREAYEHLADNATERELSNPAAASQLAAKSLQTAMQRVQRGTFRRAGAMMPRRFGRPMHGNRRVFHVQVPRGDVQRGFVIRVDVV